MGNKIVARVKIDDELWRYVKAQALMLNKKVEDIVEVALKMWKEKEGLK
jgi:hypothetical protein